MQYAIKDKAYISCLEGCDDVFRIYILCEHNKIEFAMLQQALEIQYLDYHFEELQGWIVQYRDIFIFGPIKANINQSVQRIHLSMSRIAEMCDTHGL